MDPRTLPDILPAPQFARPTGEALELSASTRILYSAPMAGRGEWIARRLGELIAERTGLSLPEAPMAGDGWRLAVTAEASPPAGPVSCEDRPEAYGLRVDARGADVSAADERGLLWAAMTLRQLVQGGEGSARIAGAEIEDAPRLAWRGFMVDSGRSPNSPPKLRRIIRICSAFKLNFLLFREGDDELNAVRYQSVPLGSRNPFALSPQEVRELAAYARLQGITLIPEIESLGHSGAKGFHYADLVAGGIEERYEGLGTHVRKRHLLPCDPRSYELLERIYDEWLDLADPPMMHLGLDEVCLDAESQARHQEGLLRMLQAVTSRRGRAVRPIVWADAPATDEALAANVVRCLWSYAEHNDRGGVSLANAHLLRQGFEQLSQPGCRQAVMLAGGSGSKHTPYSKSPAEQALHNLAQWGLWGRDRDNVLGMLAVQWSGNMLDDWLPDFLAAADVAWNPPAEMPRVGDWLARLRAHLGSLRDAATPAPHEVDPPAWDGIWLASRQWGRDIMTGKRRVVAEGRPGA